MPKYDVEEGRDVQTPIKEEISVEDPIGTLVVEIPCTDVDNILDIFEGSELKHMMNTNEFPVLNLKLMLTKKVRNKEWI